MNHAITPLPRPAVIAAAIALAATPPVCARAADLSFRDTADIPQLALRLPVITKARAVPLPPLSKYVYEFRQGDKTWRETLYDPFQLWYQSQHIGEWAGEDGTARMVVASPTSMPPAGFPRKHVQQAEFDEAVRQTKLPEAAEDIAPEQLAQWLRAFLGEDVGDALPLKPPTARLAAICEFRPPDETLHVYAFRPGRGAGGANIPDRWTVVVLRARADAARVRTAVRNGLISKVAPLARVEPPPAPGDFRTPGGLPVRPHPQRTAAHASIANLHGWTAYDSEDYVLLTNHGRKDARFVADLLEYMQTARTIYQKVITLPEHCEGLGDVATIRLFATDAEYDEYVGPDHAWSSGIFDPVRRELVIRPVDVRGTGARNKKTLEIAVHEGLHQFLFHAMNGTVPSAWLGEGLASYVEVARVDRRNPEIGENQGLLNQLEQTIKRRNSLDVKEFTRLSPQAFYDFRDTSRRDHYAIAWGLVYYLRRGAQFELGNPYKGVLERYFATLAATGDPDAATTAAFDGVDLARFTRDFRNFWQNKTARMRARRTDP